MPDVLLFHHALGRTQGVFTLADTIRQAGHKVFVPDLYEGNVFEDLRSGLCYAQAVGFDVLRQRTRTYAESLPEQLVYIGISLGVMSAQMLAQTRTGAAGAILLEACVPTSEFGERWPAHVPVQIHGMDHDPLFCSEGDLENARALVDDHSDGELYLYPGDRHLFTDASLPSYNASAMEALLPRLLSFVSKLSNF